MSKLSSNLDALSSGGTITNFVDQLEGRPEGYTDLKSIIDVIEAPTWLEGAGNAVDAAVRGAGTTLTAIPKAAAIASDALTNWLVPDYRQLDKDADARDYKMWQIGESVDEAINEKFAADPRLKDSFWAETLPGGAGSMVGFMLTSAVTGPLGAAAQGAAVSAAQQYEDALASGASADTASLAAVLALPSGMSEAIPIGRIFNRFDKASGGALKKGFVEAMKQGAIGAGEEAFQEAVLQQIPSNAIAKMYDEERELADGVLESGEAGGLLGFILSAGATALGARSRGRRGAEEPTAPSPPEGVLPLTPAAPLSVGSTAVSSAIARPPDGMQTLRTAEDDVVGPPASAAAVPLLSEEGAAAFAQANPELAERIATIEGDVARKGRMRAVREAMPEAGIEAWSQDDRNQFKGLVQSALARVHTTEETGNVTEEAQAADQEQLQLPLPGAAGPKGASSFGPGRGPSSAGGGIESGVPTETSQEAQGVTSIQNAVVAAEREKRGFSPAEQEARREMGKAWEDAENLIAADPTTQDVLIEELKTKPRGLKDDTEVALLLHRQVEIHNAIKATRAEIAAAPDDATRAQLEQREDLLNARLEELYDINKKTGTYQARGFNARKLMAAEDFSLVNMLHLKKRALAVPKLDEKSAARAEVRASYEKIADLERRLAEVTARIEKVEAEPRAAKKPPTQKPVKLKAEEAKRRVEAAWQEAEEVFKNKLFSNPIDPELVAAAVKLAKAYIDLGVATVRDFKAAVAQRIGQERASRMADALDQAWESVLAEEPPRALKGLKTRAKGRKAEYEARTAQGDFAPRKRNRTPLDKEAEDLRFQADKAKADFLRALEKDRRARRSVTEKVIGGGAEVLNTSRAIMTSFDLSAVARQGGWAVAGHPMLGGTAMNTMIRAMGTEQGFHKAQIEIAEDPNAAIHKRAGLAIKVTEGPLSQQEEAYLGGGWAKMIPILGKGVAVSERAYVAFLNKIRVDLFNSLWASLEGGTDAEAKMIANYVNVATGVGNMGQFKNMAVGLATVFFSPRFVLSRFQLVLVQPLLWKTNWRVKKLLAKEYGRSLAGLGLFYGSAGLALTALVGAGGDDEEWNLSFDPRSSDFMKLRIGKTRIDALGGLQQVTVLLSRFGTGTFTKLSGQKRDFDLLGDTGKFLQTKFSPILSSGIELYTSKNVIGEDTVPGETAARMLIPLSMETTYEAMKEEGIPKGAALGLLGVFGLGIQTHSVRVPDTKDELKKAKQLAQKDIRAMERGEKETPDEFRGRKRDAIYKKKQARESLQRRQETIGAK